MTIREMNFDDIAEIAEIEKLYSETPWDANGLLTYLLRDDTIFLVADSLDFVPAEGEAPEDYYDTPHLLGVILACIIALGLVAFTVIIQHKKSKEAD